MDLKKSLNKRIARIKYPLKTYKPNKKSKPENILEVYQFIARNVSTF